MIRSLASSLTIEGGAAALNTVEGVLSLLVAKALVSVLLLVASADEDAKIEESALFFGCCVAHAGAPPENMLDEEEGWTPTAGTPSSFFDDGRVLLLHDFDVCVVLLGWYDNGVWRRFGNHVYLFLWLTNCFFTNWRKLWRWRWRWRRWVVVVVQSWSVFFRFFRLSSTRNFQCHI
eukprot:PhM_4_TR15645/c1_g4_i1/m.6780